MHGWAFTMKDFAAMYVKKFGISEDKLMKRLWGDNFFNAKEKKWEKEPGSGDRGFVKFCLAPIFQVFETCMKKPKEEALALAEKMGVKLTTEEKDNQEKSLLKVRRSIYGRFSFVTYISIVHTLFLVIFEK